jgi:hypothetical protein
MLPVADVKRAVQGAVLFVIQSQYYDSFTRVDNTNFMFEDRYEPLGYEDTASVPEVKCGMSLMPLMPRRSMLSTNK